MNFNFKLKITREAQCNMGSDIGEMSWTGDPTVQDLIDYALSCSGEWGYVRIGTFLSPIEVKYSHGRLLESPDATFAQFLDQHIKSVEWIGGWSRSDYIVTMKENLNVPRGSETH